MNLILKYLQDRSLWAEGFKTRNGRPARIYAIDGGNGRIIHGAYKDLDNQWHICTWLSDGSYSPMGIRPLDLVRRLVKHHKVLNIDKYGHCFTHDNRELADDAATSDRVACIEIEYEEGQGL